MIKVKMNIKGCPTQLLKGFEVVTNDNGELWHYGIYDTRYKAEAAVSERPECRFIVEVLDE